MIVGYGVADTKHGPWSCRETTLPPSFRGKMLARPLNPPRRVLGHRATTQWCEAVTRAVVPLELSLLLASFYLARCATSAAHSTFAAAVMKPQPPMWSLF